MHVFPGALPAIFLEHILYYFAILCDMVDILSVNLELVRAMAVAICMTVSSLYLQSSYILR
jgi:hypothetical protein